MRWQGKPKRDAPNDMSPPQAKTAYLPLPFTLAPRKKS
jgi:hypothetical protein